MNKNHSNKSTISIALCGLGAAGLARQRAIVEFPGITLAGIISRRSGIGNLSLESALVDPNIDAIAISTENTDHAAKVLQCLEAGKHVLCDYPLALSGREARELFALAKQQNKILHVEHIALLSQEHLDLKKQAKELGALKKGEYLFQGGWNDKLADQNRTGPYPILALSRLLQVADLFGPFCIASHRLEIKPHGFTLHLHLTFETGGVLGFTEERITGLPRKRTFLAECEKGPLTWKAAAMSGGLFAKDLAWFRDRVLEGKPGYYDEELMIMILEELGKIPLPS